jgi:hypothetical protein
LSVLRFRFDQQPYDFLGKLIRRQVRGRQHGAIDERTSRHPGYAISLSKRWLVEKPFGLRSG